MYYIQLYNTLIDYYFQLKIFFFFKSPLVPAAYINIKNKLRFILFTKFLRLMLYRNIIITFI